MNDNIKYMNSIFVANTLIYPIDTAKIRYQNKIKILNKNILGGLYQGYMLNSIITIPYFTGKLSLYKFISNNKLSIGQKCLITSVCETIVGLPINNVIIQKQAKNKILSYNFIKKHIGYRGCVFQFTRDINFNLIFFNSYEFLKKNDYNFFCGFISASLAGMIVTPFDFLKTNNQLGNFELKDTYSFLKKNLVRSWHSIGYRFVTKGIFYGTVTYLSSY